MERYGHSYMEMVSKKQMNAFSKMGKYHYRYFKTLLNMSKYLDTFFATDSHMDQTGCYGMDT